MASSKLTAIRPMSDWQVQVLRCTAFYAPDEQFDISSWWVELIGDMPETETKKPKEGIIVEEGSFKEGRLILTKSRNAVDLRFQLPNEPSDKVNGIPTIGNFEEQCPEFVGLVMKLFDVTKFPPITRLAFGSTINLPSKDHKTGYIQLSEYIKSVKIDPNSRDFVYQINRRRTSKIGIEGLLINRLSTWFVATFQVLTTSLTLSTKEIKTTKNAPNRACQLTIDINTCQEYKDCLPKEKLGGIFEELVDMGKEIICQGDIE